MKTVFSLALTAFTILATSSAQSDVISPTNNDTAFRFTLARAESDYVPFQLFYDGKEIKPNMPVHVDVTQKCLDLTVGVTGAQNYWTTYCTTFKKGAITDIQIYGLKLNGQATTADGIYGDVPMLLQVRNTSGTLLSIPSKLTKFENPKLIPFFTDNTKNASLVLFGSTAALNIDPTTGVAEYTLPVETLAPITIKRLQTKTFPDFQTAQLEIKRRPSWSGAWTHEFPMEQTFAMPSQNSTSVQVLLMPWPQSDRMAFTFTSGSNPITTPDFNTGTGKRVLPQQERVLATYPTELNIYRIDVDDVAVTSIDGTTKSAKGTYTVTRLADTGTATYPIAFDAPTKTGIDVIAGKYKVVVRYFDPFTLTDEQKAYDLNFK